MLTTRQEQNFRAVVEDDMISLTVVASSLQSAIDWIASNLAPYDVFSDKDLEEWATENGYVKE